jgi:hypothetical protein
MSQSRLLSILVENKPGVLQRVASITAMKKPHPATALFHRCEKVSATGGMNPPSLTDSFHRSGQR